MQSTEKSLFLKSANFAQMLAGMWTFEGNTTVASIVYQIYSYFIRFWVVFFHLLYIVTFIFDFECKHYITETMTTFCRSVGSLLIPILLSSSKVQEMLSIVSEIENEIINFEEDDTVRIYNRYAKKINTLVAISTSSMCLVMFLWTVNIFTVVIDDLDPKDMCAKAEGQIYQFHLPINVIIQKIIASFIPLIGGLMILYGRAIPTTTAGNILTHVKILQEYIRKLDKKVQEASEKSNVGVHQCRFIILKDIARRHQNIIRLTAKVQSLNRYVVFLFYFGDSAFTASFMMIIVTTHDFSKTLPELFVVIVTLIGLYVFSLIANDLIVESTNMADIIFFETNWQDFDQKSKSIIYFMLLRSQKHLAMSTPIIGDMSLGTFLQIIKLCYTIQTFFVTQNE